MNENNLLKITEIEVINLFWKACRTACKGECKDGLIKKCEQFIHCKWNKEENKLMFVIDCSSIQYFEAKHICKFWTQKISSIKDSSVWEKCDANWGFGGVEMPKNPLFN